MRINEILRISLILVLATAALPQLQASSIRNSAVADASPSADATVVLSEQLFNEFLGSIFANLQKPAFTIGAGESTGASSCSNTIVLEKEIGGVKSRVNFSTGRITAPLAFSGQYSAPLAGCIQFQGWADTSLSLYFDNAKQALSGRLNVEKIQLVGVPTLAGGVLVPLVQGTLDQRINPITILSAEQLSAQVPIRPAGGAIRMKAKAVIPEVREKELWLRVTYEFIKG
jgi:hypothetical protein